MYRKLIIITIILTALCSGLHAQTVIEGTVLDVQGQEMDAYVTAAPKSTGYILGFANTDSKGHYKLQIKTTADSLTITASGLAIGNQVKVVPNRSQRLDFRVKGQTVQLKEVSVRAQKIRQNGDTLNYLVGAYQQQGDRVIGDVLRRMPGIEVSQNGHSPPLSSASTAATATPATTKSTAPRIRAQRTWFKPLTSTRKPTVTA